MKKIFTVALFALLVLPGLAGAAVFAGGETYTLRADETTTENLYIGAGDITIAGSVAGDVLAAGGSLVVSGGVRDDLALAGGNITVLGSVGGDARIAGGTLVVGNPVGGDLVAAGGTIKILAMGLMTEKVPKLYKITGQVTI